VVAVLAHGGTPLPFWTPQTRPDVAAAMIITTSVFIDKALYYSFLDVWQPTLTVADDGEKAEHWKDDSLPVAHTPVELTNLA